MVNGRRGEARRWEKCFIEIVKNVGSEQKRDDDRDIFFISLRWLWRGRAGESGGGWYLQPVTSPRHLTSRNLPAQETGRGWIMV